MCVCVCHVPPLRCVMTQLTNSPWDTGRKVRTREVRQSVCTSTSYNTQYLGSSVSLTITQVQNVETGGRGRSAHSMWVSARCCIWNTTAHAISACRCICNFRLAMTREALQHCPRLFKSAHSTSSDVQHHRARQPYLSLHMHMPPL